MSRLDLVDSADLRALNTFGVPARARRLALLRDEAQLPAVAELAAREGAPFVLGGGSNLLLTRDLHEPVVRVALRGIEVLQPADPSAAQVTVQAAAGEPWDALVRATVARGLWGLENLSLIWGQVGASPIQNIGAYGVEMRERFESLRAFDLRDGALRTFEAADCRFGYRDSFFKTPEGRRWLVVSVRFVLSRLPQPRLDYGELRAELAAQGARPQGPAGPPPQAPPDPRRIARAVAAVRQRKLPDPRHLGNAGSFFKNPVVDADAAQVLRARHPGLPAHPGADGACKLSAAWLIEQAGWKGARRGDAGVSDRHALVLVNHGSATGAQLLALARDIQDSVQARFGVRIEPEPVVV